MSKVTSVTTEKDSTIMEEEVIHHIFFKVKVIYSPFPQNIHVGYYTVFCNSSRYFYSSLWNPPRAGNDRKFWPFSEYCSTCKASWWLNLSPVHSTALCKSEENFQVVQIALVRYNMPQLQFDLSKVWWHSYFSQWNQVFILQIQLIQSL